MTRPLLDPLVALALGVLIATEATRDGNIATGGFAMTALLTLGGGFLLAVVWMDLMFDVQALRGSRQQPLPEPELASIANYYRRVTDAV